MLQLKATDLDDNQNAAIKYTIYDSQNKGVKELFGINENTGGIFLIKNAAGLGKILKMSFLKVPAVV